MARTSLSDELKKEISLLTSKEKDRLLFRLLPKDSKLVDQLQYKLVEEESTLEFRRDDIREYIQEYIDKYPNRYYSPNYLRLSLRDISGRITYHVAITKDKLGEIEFNLMMINGYLAKNKSKLAKEPQYMVDKLFDYIVKRAIKLVKLVDALHEDYRLEFADEMQELADHINSLDHLASEAKYQQFDVNQLSLL